MLVLVSVEGIASGSNNLFYYRIWECFGFIFLWAFGWGGLLCLRVSVTGFVGMVLLLLFTMTLRNITGGFFTRGPIRARRRTRMCGISSRRIDATRLPCLPRKRLSDTSRSRRVTASHVRHVGLLRCSASLETLTRRLRRQSTTLTRR